MAKIKERLRRVFLVLKLVTNRIAVLLVLFGFKKNTTAILFNGTIFPLNKMNWVSLLRQLHIYDKYPDAIIGKDNMQIKYMNKKLTMYWSGNDIDTLIEIFCGNPYKYFLSTTQILNKEIIDIGASIADSAILFLLNGAKYIYAYEANPQFVEIARKNLRINGFGGKCTFENKMVTGNIDGKRQEVFIDSRLENMHTQAMESETNEIKIGSISLDEIIEKNQISNAVLKMDVEGYEYEIINNTKIENLRKLSEMVIEYHYGPDRLVEKLKNAGFIVSYTTPRKVVLEHVAKMSIEPMFVGDLVARRN